ncbi:endonuclease domain-containing protein [Candidatus Neomarinimicrobiota bacterium]
MNQLPDSPKSPFQEHYRRKTIKVIAGILRRNMTPSEKKLWQAIRKRQLGGLKFLRQHPVGSSIVDLTCHEKRLALEVDGLMHRDEDVAKRDRERQELIEKYDIRFYRCTREAVEGDLAGVLEGIREVVGDRAIAP